MKNLNDFNGLRFPIRVFDIASLRMTVMGLFQQPHVCLFKELLAKRRNLDGPDRDRGFKPLV